jgi:hypothetical protein
MPVVMWTRPFQENCSLSYCKGYATSTFSIFSMFMIIHDYSISLYIILLFSMQVVDADAEIIEGSARDG